MASRWLKVSCAALVICIGVAGVKRGMVQRRNQEMHIEGAEDWPALLHSGPYTTVLSDATLDVKTGACADGCTLRLYLASPARNPALQPRSVPVVLMFSGFQLPASYYTAYMHAFSSWGYAALSYDLPGKLVKKILRDDEEIRLLPLLLEWLHQQSMNPASALYEIVDTRRVAGFGHSRGAKLAALALAGNTAGLQAAVLLEPVDMTPTTRRQGYPSAVEALQQHPHKALVIGAGLTGWCNPASEGWAAFWPTLSPGSWLHVLMPAGHCQFLDVKGVAAWGLDRMCGAGNITHKIAIHLAQGAAVAWLQNTFRQEESKEAVSAYLAWVTEAEQQRIINWSVKPNTQADSVKPRSQESHLVSETVVQPAKASPSSS